MAPPGIAYLLVQKAQHEIKPELKLLDAEERIRFDRLRIPRKRLEFLSGRTLLKNVLADYLGIPPQSVTLALTATGKPYLPVPAEAPFFNLSHAAGHYLVGVSRWPIGVDIEQARPLQVTQMRHFLHQDELSALQRIPEPERAACFYRLFTAKEAFLKATDKQWRLDEILFQLMDDQWRLIAPQRPVQFHHFESIGCYVAVCLDLSAE